MHALPRGLRWLALGIGLLWAAPISALGLVAGCAGMAAGARPRLQAQRHCLVFHGFPWGPGGAMTLGNVILDTGHTLERHCNTYAHDAGLCKEPPIAIGDHEHAHVLQTMALGVLFLPLYFSCGGVSVRNRFERAADRYAQTGQGWWPWG
ncbi:MAG: hypothetical protein KGL91_01090 [Xanthomonadaceae bacterium]|nr:hypothetical protein [Xanthomonadaceae bacterium]